jgi:proline iminopeptidase
VVPSVGGTLFCVRTFSSELRRHLKLVFAELRGSRSDLGDVGSATLDTIVDDLDRLRSELKLDRIAVLGHSGQGFIALRYAAKDPDRISHAILSGSVREF